jgi:hypothetical protein
MSGWFLWYLPMERVFAVLLVLWWGGVWMMVRVGRLSVISGEMVPAVHW